MPFVYILRGVENGRLYIGSTKNLGGRLQHHKGGWTHSTRRLGSLELVFSREYPTIIEARRIEKKLKRLKRRDYLEKIIRDGYIKTGS